MMKMEKMKTKKEDIPNSFEGLIDFLQDTAKQFRYSATRTHALRVAYEEMQESIPKKRIEEKESFLYTALHAGTQSWIF